MEPIVPLKSPWARACKFENDFLDSCILTIDRWMGHRPRPFDYLGAPADGTATNIPFPKRSKTSIKVSLSMKHLE